MTVQDKLIKILKGELQFDEGELNKMCAEAGLDAQATETYKAICKLGSAYKDSPGMKKLVSEHLGKLFGVAGDAPVEEPGEEPQAPTEQPAPKEEPSDGPPKPDAKQPPATAKEDDEMSNEPKPSPGAQQTGDAGKTSGEELQKSVDAAVKTAVAEALAKSAADAQAVIKGLQSQLDSERDERVKASWVAKAEKDLAFVPGKSFAELGAMLFELEKKAGIEIANSQFEMFKSSSAMLAKSALFHPAGSLAGSAAVTKTAMHNIETKAVELQKSLTSQGNASLDKAIAIKKALELSPESYAEYLNQNPRLRGEQEYAR